MEYAKDEFFNIRYNNDLDRLEVRKKKRPIIQLIKMHKIISLAIIALIKFSCLNFFLIYNFMKVLQNV